MVPAETVPPKVMVTDNLPSVGEVFRDKLKDGQPCPFCPQMVVVPAGRFKMGDLSGKGNVNELPVHYVTIEKPFAIGVYEANFAEYDEFAADTSRDRPGDNGQGRGERPVTNVSRDDAVAYAQWLSTQTGKTYRLPTEAEWEYAARAGTETNYWWGDDVGYNNAVCKDCGPTVDAYKPNPFGLYHTAGNVREWTCSAYGEKYNGEERKCADENNVTQPGVSRGGSLQDTAWFLRVSSRLQALRNERDNHIGFRVVKMQ